MTKKIMFLGLAILLVAGMSLFAQDTSNQSNNPSTSGQSTMGQSTTGTSAQATTVTGKVDKIDKDKKTITVKDDATGAKKTLSYNDTTTFKNGTNSAMASDLKKGDSITATVDQYNMISSVDISSGASTSAPSSQTPPQPH